MSPSLLPPPRRPWVSLAVSTLVHGLVIVLAVLLTRQPPPDERPEDRARREAEQRRQVELLYLPPPPPRPIQPPPPPRMTPPPPARQPEPEPEPNAPPDAERSPGVEEPSERETPRPRPAPEATPPTTPAPTTANAPATAPTMESEARRIFGRGRRGPAPGAGPLATRPMASDITPTKCVPRPKPPRDSAGVPQMGIVVGRIFRQDNGRPLPGAFLQMIGTPYVTFTDDDGVYRFKFDLSLVDDCRTQYVRVTARGYETQLLTLVVGVNVQNEDILLRPR